MQVFGVLFSMLAVCIVLDPHNSGYYVLISMRLLDDGMVCQK